MSARTSEATKRKSGAKAGSSGQGAAKARDRVSFGPIDVRLEEPVYFELDTEGDRIRDLEIFAGHSHRGIEYLTTKRTIDQNLVLTEKICSLCSQSHPEAFAMAAEAIAGIEVPLRAEFLRVIAAEAKRITSNLFNVGVLAHLIGRDELFTEVLEIREIVQDLNEVVFGNRMDFAAVRIGGVRYDLNGELTAWVRSELERLVPLLDEVIETYKSDGGLLERTRGIGILSGEQALACGVVGPVARGSGIACDVRVDAPYAAYDRLQVPLVTLADGDVWSRAMVRLREARVAVDLILDALRLMPDGPVAPDETPEIEAGQAIAKTEAPRGELFYFVRTNGSEYPERVKWRVPSFQNWDALRFMLQGARLDDIAVIVNSIDPCVSCTDR